MSTINEAFINALLADASYVNVTPSSNLLQDLSTGMTPTLAKFIADNFTVASAIDTSELLGVGSGFDAVAWRGKPGTPFEGKLYVSMRGTEPGFVNGADLFIADANLAFTGNAGQQVIDMVNWWLKISTPEGTNNARQIEVTSVPTGNTDPNGAPIYDVVLGEAARVNGTGQITAAELASGVIVNGHSLGGYLAGAFTRLLGTQANVQRTNTFNSAGYLQPGSEATFLALQNAIGPQLGRAAVPGPRDASQLNYFAMHGINFTTNTWWFEQSGRRVDLFNEEGTSIPNHLIYKLTDALALAAALERLDPSLTIDKANALLDASR